MCTATTPYRLQNKFLKPCRERRAEIAKRYGPLIKVVVNTNVGGLGDRYEEERVKAIADNCTHMLILEDDELPDMNIMAEFFGRGDVVTGIKCLRPGNAYMPFIWEMEHPYEVVNDRIMLVRQIRPEQYVDPFRFFGTVTSPLLINLALNIPFRPFHEAHGKALHEDCWDMALSMDLYKKGIRSVCVPKVVIQHYDIDQLKVLT